MTEPKTVTTPHKDVPREWIDLINHTPVLLSLCYDMDLLPEQFAALKDNNGYPAMWERLLGVIACYKYLEENKLIKDKP